MKCSDFIANFLKKNNIKYVFDFSGGMIVPLENSISKENGIECVPMRHEQGAGFAAEGYSRISGNFGVAIATSGPGATNLITAIGSCFFDSTSALFITGQVNSGEIKIHKEVRQKGFQETDIVSLVKSITKYAKTILDASDILYELEKSIYIMRHCRRGPVLLDIPFNIQSADIDIKNLKHFFDSKEFKLYEDGHVKSISNEELSKIQKMIQKSKRPLVLVGNGIKLSKTEKELSRFIKNTNLPVVCSLLGLDICDSYNKNFLGFIGTYGNRSANIILNNSDLVIALGSRLDLRQTGEINQFIKNKKIIHIDIDKFSRQINSRNYLFVNADLVRFFDQIKNLKLNEKTEWMSFIEKINETFNSKSFYLKNKFISNVFFDKLSNLTPNNSIIVADVGQNQMWLAQSWKVKSKQKLLFSGGMGSMGFSIPVSIGAFFANPNVSILSFCGDGGFQINIQELETIKSNKLPIKIFVLNNNSLGMVREFQDLYFNSMYQSTVIGYSCPNIKKIAYAYGFKYFSLNSSLNNQTLKSIMSCKRPSIVELKLDVKSKLQPRVVYGQSLENQFPYLDIQSKDHLKSLKNKYLSNKKIK